MQDGRTALRARGAPRAYARGEPEPGAVVSTNQAAPLEARTAAVRRLDTLSYLLDDSIPIPGTGMRVGLDAVIGLVPALGDAAGALLSCWILLEAARLGVGVPVIGRMLLNLAIDTLVGAVPVLGDIFDAGWKANDRNLRLVHRALDAPGATRRASGVVLAGVALLLLALVALGLWLAYGVIQLVIHPGSWSM
jgi:hypothetical protein